MPTLQMRITSGIGAKTLAVIFATLALIGASAWAACAGPLEDAEAAYEKTDYPTALKVWLPLAEQGNAAAQRGLGILYDNGWGVEKNKALAIFWWRKAADQGDADAQWRLGMEYVAGSKDLPRDTSIGLALITKSAEQGKTYAQKILGGIYRDGSYRVPKDISKAIVWYRRAADLEDFGASSILGGIYQFGKGVPTDTAQADFWYRKAMEQSLKAAEGGDALAMLHLADGYFMGVGGFQRDKSAALFWYRKAAQKEGRLKPMAEQGVSRLEKSLQTESNGRR